MPTSPEIPEAVVSLRQQGFIEVESIFNVAIENPDKHTRYDLIDPVSDKRLLWTPPTNFKSEELIEELLDDKGRKVFFPIYSQDNEGLVHELPPSIRPLSNTLETAPYVPEYMKRLRTRLTEFMGKIALVDPDSFGLDKHDILVNHNGRREDDVIFSILSPLQSIKDSRYYEDPKAFKVEKRTQIDEYIRGLK